MISPVLEFDISKAVDYLKRSRFHSATFQHFTPVIGNFRYDFVFTKPKFLSPYWKYDLNDIKSALFTYLLIQESKWCVIFVLTWTWITELLVVERPMTEYSTQNGLPLNIQHLPPFWPQFHHKCKKLNVTVCECWN